MPFISECLEIAPACEERMLGREGLPLLGEAGVFLTGLSTIREHYLIRRNRPEFHILMVSHDEGGALLTDGGAEGVEEVEEYDLLTEICKADSIQGYLFGHPESVPVFEKQFLEPNVEQG